MPPYHYAYSLELHLVGIFHTFEADITECQLQIKEKKNYVEELDVRIHNYCSNAYKLVVLCPILDLHLNISIGMMF